MDADALKSRILGLLLLAAAVPACTAPGPERPAIDAATRIAWQSDLEAAKGRAASEQKLVLLDFYSPT